VEQGDGYSRLKRKALIEKSLARQEKREKLCNVMDIWQKNNFQGRKDELCYYKQQAHPLFQEFHIKGK